MLERVSWHLSTELARRGGGRPWWRERSVRRLPPGRPPRCASDATAARQGRWSRRYGLAQRNFAVSGGAHARRTKCGPCSRRTPPHTLPSNVRCRFTVDVRTDRMTSVGSRTRGRLSAPFGTTQAWPGRFGDGRGGFGLSLLVKPKKQSVALADLEPMAAQGWKACRDRTRLVSAHRANGNSRGHARESPGRCDRSSSGN